MIDRQAIYILYNDQVGKKAGRTFLSASCCL